MQTFLPYPDLEQSLEVLDYRRLGKQRVEAKQLVLSHIDPEYGWKHHPASKMWVNHTYQLACYGRLACEIWMDRGYRDGLFFWFDNLIAYELTDTGLPDWWSDERVFSSHRAALLHKDFNHYSQFGWLEKPELNYVWPV